MMPKARALFEALFAQGPIAGVLEAGPGLAKSFQAFGQKILLLDSRSFRSPLGTKGGTHWGKDQEQWLRTNVMQSQTPTWIANGTTFFGAYHGGESVELNHPKSLSRLVEAVKQASQPVIFVAGDKHYSEIQRLESSLLGYETFEVTSSGIHSTVKDPKRRTDDQASRRIAHETANNFILADTWATPKMLRADLVSVGENSKVYFRHRIVVTNEH